MGLSARDYADRIRDSRWENALAKELRLYPEDERFEFLLELLPAHGAVALDLAQRCLTNVANFEALLTIAVETADPSGMVYWLRCVMPRLGFRRVVRLLKELRAQYPEGVERAVYHLSSFSAEPGFSREMIDAILDKGSHGVLRTARIYGYKKLKSARSVLPGPPKESSDK
jgi:hypothetical protein